MITGRTTNGNDQIRGDRSANRLEGENGNDTLIGGGGADTLVGGNGNDRLIVGDASGTTGLRGGDGNDFLSATLRGSGQVHMFGMDGNDTLVLDLTKNPDQFRGSDGEQINYMGHHAYGGSGADTFNFVNADDARGTIIGRIDDFNASTDRIQVDGRTVNLNNLPATVSLFEFLDQQWIQIGDNAFYALEGARNGGAERHFLDTQNLAAMLVASRDPDAQVNFIDQMNEVPAAIINPNYASATRVCFSGSADARNFIGTGRNDAVDDQRVRSDSKPEELTDGSFSGGGGDDLINAGKGDDTVRGDAGNDSIAGGLDEDLLSGGTGDDFLYGGSEDDRLLGGTGADVLEGGTGNDKLYGQQDDDVLRGNAGRDQVFGGAGNDRMSGGDNGDRMFGELGNDRMYGNDGADFMQGGTGRDTLWGGAGDDKMGGGSWSDRLHGQDGNDVLSGGQGRDTLRGDAGDDWLNGGTDRDYVWGGAGADTFAFNPRHLIDWDRLQGSDAERARKLDRIEDFEVGQDRITLSGFTNTDTLADLSISRIMLSDVEYAMVGVDDTNQRLLVRVEDPAGWSALASADNFDFI